MLFKESSLVDDFIGFPIDGYLIKDRADNLGAYCSKRKITYFRVDSTCSIYSAKRSFLTLFLLQQVENLLFYSYKFFS